MGWVDRRPHDVASQILEFAESGRLVEGPRSRRDERRSAIALVVVAALMLGASIGVAVICSLAEGSQTVILVGVVSGLGSLTILVPAIRLVSNDPGARPIRVRPAAVLPPELIHPGNWIHRDGAWQRVEHIGRDGGGRIHALLSSGEVAELSPPATIAGDVFRPAHDPVASLRD